LIAQLGTRSAPRRPRGAYDAHSHLTSRLVGILDWDGAHIGDPAADVASIAVTVGWDAAASIAPDLMSAARKYAATFALQQALPAFFANDRANLHDGLTRYIE